MKTWLLMLLLFCLGVASCEAPSPCMDEAEVEILLRTDAGDVADAEVLLRCMTGNGLQVTVPAKKVGDGHYLAALPSDYTPATPFIVVSVGEDTCACSVTETSFNSGQLYRYVLELHSEGCSLHIGVMEWNTVDVSIDLS